MCSLVMVVSCKNYRLIYKCTRRNYGWDTCVNEVQSGSRVSIPDAVGANKTQLALVLHICSGKLTMVFINYGKCFL